MHLHFKTTNIGGSLNCLLIVCYHSFEQKEVLLCPKNNVYAHIQVPRLDGDGPVGVSRRSGTGHYQFDERYSEVIHRGNSPGCFCKDYPPAYRNGSYCLHYVERSFYRIKPSARRSLHR